MEVLPTKVEMHNRGKTYIEKLRETFEDSATFN